jgi:hypothetical protein
MIVLYVYAKFVEGTKKDEGDELFQFAGLLFDNIFHLKRN